MAKKVRGRKRVNKGLAWVIAKQTTQYATYLSACLKDSTKPGYIKKFGIGNIKVYEEKWENPVEYLKGILKDAPIHYEREDILKLINEKTQQENVKRQVFEEYPGLEVISGLFDHFDLFRKCKDTRKKDLNLLVQYQIFQRISKPQSMLQTYLNSKKTNKFATCKNSFYRSLDYIYDNREQMLQNINDAIIENKDREVEVLWFDSTTIYFETFDKEGLKQPGYSKDGKFKEDQFVIGMITDKNGIPLHYKVFPGNTPDSKTFIPFMIELEKIYKIKNVTIVADRGMSVSSNIRFLEQKGYKFIISYKLKGSKSDVKNWVLDGSHYLSLDEKLFYKEITNPSLYGLKNRPNGHNRRLIATWSEKRYEKDKHDREVFEKIFNRSAVNGKVPVKSLNSQKHKYFKISDNKVYYTLDHEKIQKDKKFDGFYVYETNRFDLDAKKIIDTYARQWKIEENFRFWKGNLQLRPIYFSSEKHILGHIALCFISLVMMTYLTYKVNTTLNLEKPITKNSIVKAIEEVWINKEYENKILVREQSNWNEERETHYQIMKLIKTTLEILKMNKKTN
ncbi:IS1634 family transposase [Mycoplasma sp. NEAQ87857]|uniref:IS1634 family transposase n=1 Tax=Mycoplasma sp. NEAQ87857 TaxID=2683967 RepID=UPI00131969A8|nr:IS1634 family transposase [Mycoplasma sp. NEAQ87857]QGZ97761.1 IS1634 family transposase [Mycoplasma sp. NEAQ87857]QGZ97887.1 IS1634 family transposase [Mycoplasma sp. NEAQ87857]